MTWTFPTTRIRAARAALAALTVAVLILAGCAEQAGTANGGAGATTTTAADSANTVPAVSGTPQAGQMTLAASPSADTTATSDVAEPGTPETSEPSGSETPPADEVSDAEYTYTDTFLASGGGGGTNKVQVINKNDGKFRLKADLQLNRIPGPRVEPTNLAVAYASCADCQTIAVALQINLISRTASYVAPENVAVAVNFECSNCYTVARAIQYTMSVDDPTQVPPEVDAMLKELDKELMAIRHEQDLSIDEVEQRLNAVIDQFRDLAEGLKDDRDETLETTTPGATPIADDGTPTTEASPTPANATQTAETSATTETPVAETPTPSIVPGETATAETATPALTATATAVP